MEFTMNPDGSLAPGKSADDNKSQATGPQGPANAETAPQAPTTTPTASAYDIKDSDTANFKADVIETSMVVPVIVDFWAPWCGPCKQLGPSLEKLVRAAAGLVKLVKINVDENKDLAAQMQIQSIPAVFAFKGGQPVNEFAGALPESQLKAFIDKLTEGAQSPLDADLDLAQAALDDGDMATAGGIFAKIQSQDPENEKALAGMIRVALAAGEIDRAKDMIASLTPVLLAKPEVAAACAQVDLSQQTQETGDVDELLVKLAQDENDHQARFDLSMALYGQGQNQLAVDGLLDLFGRAPKWDDDAARKQLLKIFEALGAADPVIVEGRKQLSTLLFS